jgi:hypothetical protein
MAQRTITRLYASYDEAAAVVADLETAGFQHSDISLVGNHVEEERETGPGAGIGAVVGGGAGLLAGIGMLAIPGIGPVVAAGWLVATLAGAGVGGVAGGLIGSMVKAGVSDEEAQVYAEGIRRGGSLVSVRADERRAVEAERIMDQRGNADWRTLDKEYRAAGWTRFDESAGRYVPPSVMVDEDLNRR